MTAAARFSRHDFNLLIVSLIWGANYTVSKYAVAQVPPVVYAGVRFVVSTALLWILYWRQEREPIGRRAVAALLFWGVIGYSLNQYFFLTGLRLTSATNSAVIFGSLPLVVAVLGVIVGHERPPPRVWAGIVLGSLGVALVVGARGIHFSRQSLEGDILSVLALLFWAVFTVGVRRSAMTTTSLHATALVHLGGTPGLLLAAIPELPEGAANLGRPGVWAAILYASLLSSVVASVLWTRSLKALGGSRVALFNCLTPLVAGAVAWLSLGERPLPLQFVGAGLVVAGVLASRVPPQVEEP